MSNSVEFRIEGVGLRGEGLGMQDQVMQGIMWSM